MSVEKTPKPKKPRTEAQREAARRNGAKSRGPVTPEGKQKSSRNSTQHGLTAEQIFVLNNESEEAFFELRDAIIARFQPVDELETDLCIEMAHARWRLHRIWTI